MKLHFHASDCACLVPSIHVFIAGGYLGTGSGRGKEVIMVGVGLSESGPRYKTLVGAKRGKAC